jgi:two-component sensor histidine kinase/CHASE3 domain sensor protein
MGVLGVKEGARVTWAAAALLAVGLIALIIVVSMTVRLVQATQRDFVQATTARDLARAAVQLRHGLVAAESSQRGFVVSNNEIYLAPYGTARDQAFSELDRMATLMTPEQRDSPATLRLIELVHEKFDELDETIAFKRAGEVAQVASILNSNRGKALMDQVNVFLSSVIRSADATFAEHVSRQRDGLVDLQRTVTVASIVILMVVAASIGTVGAFARNLGKARDAVADANAGLERRVEQRTAELSAARDRAELLLSEVNHRVANSLSLVASMVRLQARATEDPDVRTALSETEGRISAVALVHKKLYSSGDVRLVDLGEFLASMLEQLEVAMRDQGHQASLEVEIEPIQMPTDRTVSLGVIVTEWVTNAFKYAYPGGKGQIRIRLKRNTDDRVELRIEDDGVGRKSDQAPKGTGLGTRLVSALASGLGAQIAYLEGNPGTIATLVLPIKPEAA